MDKFLIHSTLQVMPFDESILDVGLAVRVLVCNNEYYGKLFVQQQGTGDEYRAYCLKRLDGVTKALAAVPTEKFRSQQVARVRNQNQQVQ